MQTGSNGYANKLKYLFLCNSTVLHVLYGADSREFFEYNLLAGEHYIAVPTVEELPGVIRALQQDPARARTVAEAGTKRMMELDMYQVTNIVQHCPLSLVYWRHM